MEEAKRYDIDDSGLINIADIMTIAAYIDSSVIA